MKFQAYGKNAREWVRRCQLLLPEIARRKIWKKKGFGSIYEYAAKLAGMSRYSVDNALWVLRKIEDKPELQRVVEEKGIERVRPIANVATKEDESFWAERAREMSKHVLETFVRERKMSNRENSCPGAKTQPEKVTVSMDLDLKLAAQLENLKGDGTWEDLMKRLLFAGVSEKPKAVKSKSRYIPAKIKEYAISKTHGFCAYPNCKKKYKILHHTQRFALERVHDPDRLQPLCKAHERLAHLEFIENEEGPPDTWKLRKFPNHTDYKYYIDQFVALSRPT